MFENVMNFAKHRTKGQAFGFWLVFFIIGVVSISILSMIIGAIAVSLNMIEDTFDAGAQLGMNLGILIVPFYVAYICWKVKSARNYPSIWPLVIGILLSFIGGAFLGLIPAAYMTTKDKVDTEEDPTALP